MADCELHALAVTVEVGKLCPRSQEVSSRLKLGLVVSYFQLRVPCLDSAGSVASHDYLKAFAVERQLAHTHRLAISVGSHFDAIKLVSSRFQDESGKPFLPEGASQRKGITFTRRSCYLQQYGTGRNE
jgi:hypothetical protein